MTMIKLKRATATGHTPGALAAGEFAVNEYDRLLFRRDPDGANEKVRFETLLAKGSISNAATLDLQLPTGWKQFRFRFSKGTTARDGNSDSLWHRFSTDGGLSFDSNSNYLICYDNIWYDSGAHYLAAQYYDTGGLVGYLGKGSFGAGETFIEREVFGGSTYVIGRSLYWAHLDTYDTPEWATISHTYQMSAAVNAIRFYTAYANINTLLYALYGVQTG